jgi:hypothetical protein
MIVRAQIIDVCASASRPLEFVNDATELEDLLARAPGTTLVICNLAEILSGNQEMEILIRLRSTGRIQIMGRYPHVATKLRDLAKSQGIDYIVPNSGFTKRLQQLLGRG